MRFTRNINEYLESKQIKPSDIAKGTELPIEMINGIISGKKNIMDVSLGSVLLLCLFLKLPVSDFAGCCAEQQDAWKITDEDGFYYLSFSVGTQKFSLQLAPISSTNTKYIKIIAAFHYELFLDGIIDVKRGQVSVYRKQVELELRKLDVSDTFIQLIDNETLEDLLDTGNTPQEAAAKIVAEEDSF